MSNTICLLPGDGIGQEVVPAAVAVLNALDLGFATETHPIGWDCFEATGSALPDTTLAAVATHQVALFGATSSPTGGAAGYNSPILALRKQLNLYANVRPVKSLANGLSRADIDMLIVRENTEGLYVRQETATADRAEAKRIITREASFRIGAYAAKEAAKRRGVLTITHKANVLVKTDGLFLEAATAGAQSVGADIEINTRIVDALAHDLVMYPERFDVIVAPNLYGDILSDLCSGLVGGLGVAPSGNIGDTHAVFEPVHGSAPDIAGQGIANPTATLQSLAMLLTHVEQHAASQRLQTALSTTFADGILPRDLGGSADTNTFTAAVIARL